MVDSENTDARRRGQFGVRTLLLVIAAVASWLAWYQAASDIAAMKSELPGLRRATRELVVADSNQFAAVEKPQFWAGEFRWEVHVPEGRTGQLHLALDGIAGKGYPTPACSVPVQPGVNVVEYKKKQGDDWSFSLRCGDQAEETTRPTEWRREGSTTTYVQRFSETRSQSADAPLELQRDRDRGVNINTDAKVEAYNAAKIDGELIWIELD